MSHRHNTEGSAVACWAGARLALKKPAWGPPVGVVLHIQRYLLLPLQLLHHGCQRLRRVNQCEGHSVKVSSGSQRLRRCLQLPGLVLQARQLSRIWVGRLRRICTAAACCCCCCCCCCCQLCRMCGEGVCCCCRACCCQAWCQVGMAAGVPGAVAVVDCIREGVLWARQVGNVPLHSAEPRSRPGCCTPSCCCYPVGLPAACWCCPPPKLVLLCGGL
jgi:hypothetical protein